MAWLVREAQVLAALDSPSSPDARTPLIKEPTQTDDTANTTDATKVGIRLLRRPVLIHTMRPGAALDVAWCRAEPGAVLVVRRVAVIKPWRLACPGLRAPAVVVAPAGAFERWQLRVGDRLEVKGG